MNQVVIQDGKIMMKLNVILINKKYRINILIFQHLKFKSKRMEIKKIIVMFLMLSIILIMKICLLRMLKVLIQKIYLKVLDFKIINKMKHKINNKDKIILLIVLEFLIILKIKVEHKIQTILLIILFNNHNNQQLKKP